MKNDFEHINLNNTLIEFRQSLQEMVDAMEQYEMDVEESPPYKHRAMMERAHALLATKLSEDKVSLKANTIERGEL